MELEVIDIVFWVVILLIALGGIVCLMIFLPREHEYDDARKDCYRIEYRDGSYKLSHKKAVYGENRFSIRSKFFYITRIPFQTDAFCDEATAKDGVKYRAAATVTVFFPEDKLQTFAMNFHNVGQDSIAETVEEALTSALTEAMSEYDSNADKAEFEKHFKDTAAKKLDLFGLIVMNINSLNITALKQPGDSE